MEISVFNIFPEASWNDSSIRCVTFNGTDGVAFSADEILMLTEGGMKTNVRYVLLYLL